LNSRFCADIGQGRNGKSGLINIDKNGANKAGAKQFDHDNNRHL